MSDRPMPRIWRLAPVIALAAVLALLAAGFGLAIYIDHSNDAQRVGEITVQARTLAATVTAALAFNDRRAAQEYVSAVQANPEIQQAAIYDSSGTLFASWSRRGSGAPPPRFQAVVPRITNGHLVVTEPVLQDRMAVGAVYLESTTEPLARRLQRYGVIGVLIGMAILVVSVLANTHRELSRANTELIAANHSLRDEIAQREKVEAALRQAQKMEAIGQLTGGVAHDFNNLLQVILGNQERLLRRVRGEVDAEIIRMVSAAMRAAERAAILTQRLLAFSRRQPLAPKPLDANKLVTGLLDLITRSIGESIQVQTMLAGGLWRCLADENQLESALLNLAVNARDAMPQGGRLVIETANTELDAALVRDLPDEAAPGKYVMIAVRDTGTGMAPDVLAHVFEPFFTTKDIGQGTGLGLSQVYGFVRQSEGHVRIDTEPGRGTAVRLYLPRLAADQEIAEHRPPSDRMPAGHHDETILLVEDQEDVRAYTAVTLRELGYDVIEAADGHDALDRLRALPQVRLLFSDIGLPGGMDGRTLAAEARRLHPGLRVLLATGYARALLRHGRVGDGPEIVSKPFTQAELAQRVRAALDRHEPAVS